MPFEAGLATALMLGGTRHDRFILEAEAFRLQKSLSDLSGTDPVVHGETARGMLRAIEDLFRRRMGQPSPEHVVRLYSALNRIAWHMKRNREDLYQPSAFRVLVATAQRISEQLRIQNPRV